MILSAISLVHFRGVPRLEIALDPRMTILVGKNGVGKSSILDAIAIMLFQVQHLWNKQGINPRYSRDIVKPGDVQIGFDDFILDLDFSFEDAIGEQKDLSLSFRASDTHYLSENNSFEIAKSIIQNQTLLSEKDQLLIYYKQDRGFEDKRSSINSENTNSLFGSLRAISQLESWWDRHDAEEARHVRDVDRSYRDPQLEAVRNLIKQVDGFVGISFSSKSEPQGIYFERSDGVKIHVSALSSGERAFIILLADLARRLQLSRPGVPLSQIPAIVLIDEIELHLHPSWQSKIAALLRNVFCSCQFIVTTHSPQVLSSIESNHVRIIEKINGILQVRIPFYTKGYTSNYLLEGVFDAHERFPDIDILFDDFNRAVSRDSYEEARDILERLTQMIEGEPPELLLLRKRLKGMRA